MLRPGILKAEGCSKNRITRPFYTFDCGKRGYVGVHVCVRAHAYLSPCRCMFMHVSLCVQVCAHVSVSMCVHTSLYVRVCACMCAHVSMCGSVESPSCEAMWLIVFAAPS